MTAAGQRRASAVQECDSRLPIKPWRRARGRKTQTLSLRLDAETRFILDFIATARNQSVTRVLELAIHEVGENALINGKTWRELWGELWDQRVAE